MPVAGAMWAVNSLGLFNGIRLIPSIKAGDASMAVMLGVLFVTTIGLISLIVPESRFSAIPAALLSVLAVHYVLTCSKPAILVACLMVGLLGSLLAERLISSAVTRPESRLQYQCNLGIES